MLVLCQFYLISRIDLLPPVLDPLKFLKIYIDVFIVNKMHRNWLTLLSKINAFISKSVRTIWLYAKLCFYITKNNNNKKKFARILKSENNLCNM